MHVLLGDLLPSVRAHRVSQPNGLLQLHSQRSAMRVPSVLRQWHAVCFADDHGRETLLVGDGLTKNAGHRAQIWNARIAPQRKRCATMPLQVPAPKRAARTESA